MLTLAYSPRSSAQSSATVRRRNGSVPFSYAHFGHDPCSVRSAICPVQPQPGHTMGDSEGAGVMCCSASVAGIGLEWLNELRKNRTQCLVEVVRFLRA